MTKHRIVIYPGTFDPVTLGHLDLIDRALQLFDRVIVGVAAGQTKQPLFCTEERVSMIRSAVRAKKRVTVEPFDGLVVNYARKRGVHALIRGIRMISDFENEFQMALTNRKMNESLETVFLMPNEKYTCLTSRLIKEIAFLGGDVRPYVPAGVHRALIAKAQQTAE